MNYAKLEEANELKTKIDFCKTILAKGFPNRGCNRYRVNVGILDECSYLEERFNLKDDFLNDFCKFIKKKLTEYENEFEEL